MGRICNPEGEPIDVAEVVLKVRRGDTSTSWANTRTTAEGRYEFDLGSLRDIPEEEWSGLILGCMAWREGFMPGEGKPVRGFFPEQRRGTPWQVDLTLEPGGSVTGRVVDHFSQPVADAYVVLMTLSATKPPDFSAEGHTDRAGEFRLGVGPQGRYWISATKTGAGLAVAGPLELDPAVPRRLPDLVLRSGASLEGSVQYEDGNPASNLGMSLDLSGKFAGFAKQQLDASRTLDPLFARLVSSEGCTSTRCETDDAGRFRTSGLQPGEWSISFGTRGDRSTGWKGMEVFEVETGTTDIRIVLPVHRIHCRVVDDRGRPRPQARLRCRGYSGEAAERLLALRRPGGEPDPGWRQLVSFTKGGSWALEWPDATKDILIQPGTVWVVETEMPGTVPAVRTCVVPPGTNEVRCELVLQDADPPGWVEFALTGPDGTPVRDFLYSIGRNLPTEWAGIRGGARPPTEGRSEPTSAGTWQVVVIPGQDGTVPFLPWRSEVVVRPGVPTRLEARLPIGGWLCWTVADPGTPLPRAWTDLQITLTSFTGSAPQSLRRIFDINAEDRWITSLAGFRGGRRYRVPHPLKPGWYCFRFAAEGWKPYEENVLVEAEKETDVHVTLK